MSQEADLLADVDDCDSDPVSQSDLDWAEARWAEIEASEARRVALERLRYQLWKILQKT